MCLFKILFNFTIHKNTTFYQTLRIKQTNFDYFTYVFLLLLLFRIITNQNIDVNNKIEIKNGFFSGVLSRCKHYQSRKYYLLSGALRTVQQRSEKVHFKRRNFLAFILRRRDKGATEWLKYQMKFTVYLLGRPLIVRFYLLLTLGRCGHRPLKFTDLRNIL